nr:hypothetical protein [Tanacetum cinerariifolium]
MAKAPLPFLTPRSNLTRIIGVIFIVISSRLRPSQSPSVAFRNFIKKPGQSSSFSTRPMDQPINVGSPLVEPLQCVAKESLEEDPIVVQVASKMKISNVPRRMSARGSVPPLSATAPKGDGKHPWVLARFNGKLASSFDSLSPGYVEEARDAHNMISSLYFPLLRDKLGFLSFDEFVDVYDVHALQMASKNRLLEHEMLKLEDRLANAQKNQDVEGIQKKLYDELSGLQPRLEEAERLRQRSQDLDWERVLLFKNSEEIVGLSSELVAVKLEKDKLVRDILPSPIKKLFESKHFNQALGDL